MILAFKRCFLAVGSLRRCITLYRLLSEDIVHPSDVSAEVGRIRAAVAQAIVLHKNRMSDV